MYKLGICKGENLVRVKTVLGKNRQISYSLLKMSSPVSAADVTRFETVIRSAATSSGIARTTYGSRFDDLDAVTQGVLQHLFHQDQSLEIYDLGASDALLSMQWANRVFDAFPRARMTASDIILHFTEATWAASGETYILEPDGTPIQYIKPPFVVSLARSEHPMYVLNALVRRLALWRLKKRDLCSEPVLWRGVPDSSVINRGGWVFRQIPLVHPAALSFASKERFRVVEADAFCALPSLADAIRAMNLYQTRVFTVARLRQGIRAVFDSVVEGGIFIAGKSVEGDRPHNNVSIFQKVDGRFRILERLGKGFELEQLVLETSLRAAGVLSTA
jgi:hypothetical protein